MRFSASTGMPTVADNAPEESSPQGWRSGSTWPTTFIPISSPTHYNGFPARTGEEFLEFFRAVAASGPGAPAPPPIVAFLATHPAAKAFVEAPEADPGEFRPAALFRHHRLQVHERRWPEPFRPVPPRPGGGDRVPDRRAGGSKTADFLAAEMSERLAKGPARFRVLVQLAQDRDDVTDATAVWPETRRTRRVRDPHPDGASRRARPGAAENHLRPGPQRRRNRPVGRPADRGTVGYLPAERPPAAG